MIGRIYHVDFSLYTVGLEIPLIFKHMTIVFQVYCQELEQDSIEYEVYRTEFLEYCYSLSRD